MRVLFTVAALGSVGVLLLALWVVSDLNRPLLRCMVEWLVEDDTGTVITRGSARTDVPQQRAHRVSLLTWRLSPGRRFQITLRLLRGDDVLDENCYQDLFHPLPRPAGYPWHFDTRLGMRCFGGPYAGSSLRVFNTWYGRIAALFFPVYRWAEGMLENRPNPRLSAFLRRVFG